MTLLITASRFEVLALTESRRVGAATVTALGRVAGAVGTAALGWALAAGA